MPSPRPRASRCVSTLSAAAGLVVACVALTGCDYPAGAGSSVVSTFSGCGDPASIVRGCTTGIDSTGVVIRDAQGWPRDLDGGSITTRYLGGTSLPLVPFTPATGSGQWSAAFRWPLGVDPDEPVVQRLYTKAQGLLLDRWILTLELPTRAGRTAPVASLFPHDSPAASGPAPAAPTILDARQSTGTALAYSWDTNGDGTYGDDPLGGWTGIAAPAAGTAYIPLGALAAPRLTPHVKVSDTAGQIAETQVEALPIWADGAGGLGVAAAPGGQISLLPSLGTLPTGGEPLIDVHYACIDIGDDRTYDTALPLLYMGAHLGFQDHLSVPWTGARRVRVAFFADGPATTPPTDRGTCAAPAPGALVLSTHTELVDGTTKAAMELGGHAKAKPGRYTGTARVRLAGGTLIAAGTQAGTSIRGVINRGRFTLRTPPRAGGRERPAGIAAFASGTFASRSDAALGLTDDGRASIVGTTTMVIRGAGRALACLNVAQTDTSTTWTVMGGTGVARTLRMTMTGGATLNSLVTSAVRVNTKATGTGGPATRALSPVSTRFTVNAAQGAGRGLSAACRGLVKRLP